MDVMRSSLAASQCGADEFLDEGRKSDPGPRGSIVPLRDDPGEAGEPPSEEGRVSDPGPRGSVVLGSAFDEDGEAEFGAAPAPLPAPLPAPERQGGGDLFLTCFRLRFEERGSWTEASDMPVEKDKKELEEEKKEAEDEVAPLDAPDGAVSSTPSFNPKARPSWKEWSGRERGSDKFRPDDLVRGIVRAPIVGLQNSIRRRNNGGLNGPAFACCSANAQIAEEGGEALRSEGATERGIVATAPLLSIRTGQENHAGQGRRSSLQNIRASLALNKPQIEFYFFEFVAAEVSPNTTRGVMLGFCWDIPAQGSDPGSWPEFAEQLPRSFVVGGLNVNGWRPIIHVSNRAKIGILLEIKKAQRPRRGSLGGEREPEPPMSCRMIIFQDDEKVTEATKEMPHEERGPHGVLDLCGNVARVQLLASTAPPEQTAPGPRQ